jgi:hypothetical protein
MHMGSPLTAYDSVMLSALEEVPLMPVLKSSALPYKLDNSRLPYYREIYQQVSSECGQVSGIAYNFTYEINRLRNLPASAPENQYPPHFPFNFMNGGHGWHGVSYFHSFEILRSLGCPDVATYGGMAAGGDSRWMTGHHAYLKAMKNRIRAVYQIRVGSPEGLDKLKHWLHNHLDGSVTGGVASFYANAPWNPSTLAPGTPEEGKHVITAWGGLPSHAMTIVGYNDSIRFDYNGDGMFTNDADINGDSVVDMRDWEIGGLLFADGWGYGINFADSGRCFVMYKTLAEKSYEGGIWNHAVHVLDVKEGEPALTARIRVSHTRRGKIKVSTGISSGLNDSLPEHSISFPVFNYQGGSQYMQGGISTDTNKTIEFGLDISPLLGYALAGEANHFFLIIDEYDPDNLGEGSILYFSVTDHTGAPHEVSCQGLPLAVNNNGRTMACVTFDKAIQGLEIITSGLPTAVVGEPYGYQMETAGATPPVRWTLLNSFSEEPVIPDIPSGGTYMEPDNWEHGNIMVPLPFNFNFMGDPEDTIYIHAAGFIMFDDTQDPWPYMYDHQLFLSHNRCIAPFLSRQLVYVADSGHGIWVDHHNAELTVRWKARINSLQYDPGADFSLALNENGKITFMYARAFEPQRLEWACGISFGDKLNHYFPSIMGMPLVEENTGIRISVATPPEEISLSSDGYLSATAEHYYHQEKLTFLAEDDKLAKTQRTLEFSATDLGTAEFPREDLALRAFPNPFRETLTIRFDRAPEGPVTCMVFTPDGKHIATPVANKTFGEGEGFYWDGHSFSGLPCPAGIYFLQISAGHAMLTRKVILAGH